MKLQLLCCLVVMIVPEVRSLVPMSPFHVSELQQINPQMMAMVTDVSRPNLIHSSDLVPSVKLALRALQLLLETVSAGRQLVLGAMMLNKILNPEKLNSPPHYAKQTLSPPSSFIHKSDNYPKIDIILKMLDKLLGGIYTRYQLPSVDHSDHSASSLNPRPYPLHLHYPPLTRKMSKLHDLLLTPSHQEP